MCEKISVITISCNSEKTIEKTFVSILAQTYRPLEYVLVDGDSKDGTISLIEKYIPRFKLEGIEVNFKSEPDNGISDAFNKGIERATGSIIGIINSDDRLERDALINIISAFDESIDVVCGDCMWIDEHNGLKYVRKSCMELEKLKYEMVLMHPTCFVRKTAYKKYGVFDLNLRFAMDKDLMARFYRQGAKFKYVPNIIASMSAGGVSDVNTEKVLREGVIVAVRNGVSEWDAYTRYEYKKIKHKCICLLKKAGLLKK